MCIIGFPKKRKEMQSEKKRETKIVKEIMAET
jgi:hypothetical protein